MYLIVLPHSWREVGMKYIFESHPYLNLVKFIESRGGFYALELGP